MADYKGTGVVFMRKHIQSAGSEIEKKFLEQLTSDEAKQYRLTLNISWVPVELVTKFFEVAAPLLYPGDPAGLFKIGKAMADDNLNGIYRFLLKITTVPFLAEQSAKLWTTYHKKGIGRSVWKPGEKNLDYYVCDYPELPLNFRNCLDGYVAGTFQKCVKNTRIKRDDSDPSAWKWTATWE